MRTLFLFIPWWLYTLGEINFHKQRSFVCLSPLVAATLHLTVILKLLKQSMCILILKQCMCMSVLVQQRSSTCRLQIKAHIACLQIIRSRGSFDCSQAHVTAASLFPRGPIVVQTLWEGGGCKICRRMGKWGCQCCRLFEEHNQVCNSLQFYILNGVVIFT